MCNFFSFCYDGFNTFLYSDWEIRKNNLKEKVDSHTWILTHFKIPPKQQDKWDYFEFNPLTKKFIEDNPSKRPDIDPEIIDKAQAWVEALDFKTIIPQLIIKPIVNPLKNKPKKVTKKIKMKLREWSLVWNSVPNSVWDSVRTSVWDSVRTSVWDSMLNSVWDSVRASMWDSMLNSVWDSVRASMLNSVWDSMRAYVSSFLDIEYKYDFSSVLYLWEHGFIPSFDGTTWRLHSGKDATIVYENK
jgi:hypothetical protein